MNSATESVNGTPHPAFGGGAAAGELTSALSPKGPKGRGDTRLLRKRMAVFLTFYFCLLTLYGCGSGSQPTATPAPAPKPVTTIVVYSPHGKLKPEAKTRFEAKHPEYKVEFLDLGGGEILTRVKAEKEQPRADVWWGGAPADFNQADAQGLLEPYQPDWAKNLPPEARSKNGGWVATWRTPEVIMFNPKKISRDDVPKTWDGLIDPKWKGKIVIRDVRPSATMKTIFGGLIAREFKRTGSDGAGFEFLKKLDANTGMYAANPVIMNDMLINDGPLALTVWNLPDAQQLKGEGKPIDYVIPKETPVPVEPVAILKNAPNPAGAKAFHDFVNSPDELMTMAQERYRIPARSDLPKDKLPQWMRELEVEVMNLDWALLEKNLEGWIAQWDSEIKGKHNK